MAQAEHKVLDTCKVLAAAIVKYPVQVNATSKELLECIQPALDQADMVQMALWAYREANEEMDLILRSLMECLQELNDQFVVHVTANATTFPLLPKKRLEVIANRLQKLVLVVVNAIKGGHLSPVISPLEFITADDAKKFWFSCTAYGFTVKWDVIEQRLSDAYKDDSTRGIWIPDLKLYLDNYKTGYVSVMKFSDFVGSSTFENRINEYRAKVKPVPSAPPAPSAQVSLPLILWVDDRPQNNTLERQAAEDRGINVILVESTAEAKDWMADHVEEMEIEEPHLFRIITDNTRIGKDTVLNINAGEDIIRFVRGRRSFVPILVYCGNVNNAQYVNNYKGCTVTNDRAQCLKYISEIHK